MTVTTAAPSIMATARFILDEAARPMTTMKLQKLCYFAQGWTLAWTEGIPLFSEDFEAWRNGPVCPQLYRQHRGKYAVGSDDLPEAFGLQPWHGSAIKAAIEPYRLMTGQQLSEITHGVGPWVDARAAVGASAPSNTVISKEAMQVFFQELSATTP